MALHVEIYPQLLFPGVTCNNLQSREAPLSCYDSAALGNVRVGHLQPDCVRSSQATLVHPVA
jgi:hypothetical protein